MRIEIPQLSLVALVGASASGKSTFAHKYFKPTEVLSSDFFRGIVGDDEADQSVTDSAFDLLFKAAEIRLALGRLTVIDATNIQKNSHKSILDLAKRQNVHSAAIVLDTSLKTLLERNANLALKEFALGVEALSRFVKKEPLYRVYQCAFGVLAMESEPTDPRL